MSLTGFAAGVAINTATLPTKGASPPFTFASWIKPAAIGSRMDVCGIGRTTTTTDRHQLLVSPAGKVIAETIAGATSGRAVGTTVMSANSWNHVAGVWSATNTREAFLNGISEATDSTSATPTVSVVRGGRQSDNNDANHFNGLIDSIALWSRVLTNAEILLLAKGVDPRSLHPYDLELLYLFDSSSVTHGSRNANRVLHASTTLRMVPSSSSLKFSDEFAPWDRLESDCGTLSLLRSLSWYAQEEGYILQSKQSLGSATILRLNWKTNENGEARTDLAGLNANLIESISVASNSGFSYSLTLEDTHGNDYFQGRMSEMSEAGEFRILGLPILNGERMGLNAMNGLQFVVRNGGAFNLGRAKIILQKIR